MKIRGVFRNGVVVLHHHAAVPDGTQVVVEIIKDESQSIETQKNQEEKSQPETLSPGSLCLIQSTSDYPTKLSGFLGRVICRKESSIEEHREFVKVLVSLPSGEYSLWFHESQLTVYS